MKSMGKINGAYTLPSEDTVIEAAVKLFEVETGLHIEERTWQYRQIPDRGASAARFALTDGKKTVFSNVLVVARYSTSQDFKLEVQASINGLPSVRRVFYVVEESPTLLRQHLEPSDRLSDPRAS